MRRTKSESEETRQRIMNAAETVFVDIGVSRASMEKIAAEAGVTRGAIYWHFANKQEMLGAIIRRVHGIHDAVIARAFEDGSEPLQSVLDWALEVIELFASDEHTRKVYKIVVTRCEYVGEMQEALVWQQEMHATMDANFTRAFEAAEAEGQLGRGWDACTASLTLRCFMSGMLDNWLRYEFDASLAKTLRGALQCLLASFRCDVQVPATPQREPKAQLA